MELRTHKSNLYAVNAFPIHKNEIKKFFDSNILRDDGVYVYNLINLKK